MSDGKRFLKQATQTDVAQAAGVSTATVSRVLNGSLLVRDEVRARVEAAISALGYIPHESARSLATRRSRALGAVIPTLNNAIFASGVNALEQAARERGYSLVISISNYDLDLEAVLVRQMIERGVDGLMLVGNDHTAAARALLATTRLRHICAWAWAEDAASPNIGFDNAAAMAEVVDHLVADGYRRIAMLAGPTAGNDRARDRVQGAVKRLAGHGLSLVNLIETPYSIREARAAAIPLLAARPDAVICGNDVIAFGVHFAAREAGLAIPDDIAITGFDDLTLTAELSPAITTVTVPAAEMGRLCAQHLIDAIETDTDPVSLRLDTRLVIRQTTRAASGAIGLP
ncbi:MAG: LacI family DNA-binding transcriptional regulator [Tabrizicola sp.]|nr:LacI family DNA-binding transcriptional regulator [Tabrizicola sp.]